MSDSKQQISNNTQAPASSHSSEQPTSNGSATTTISQQVPPLIDNDDHNKNKSQSDGKKRSQSQQRPHKGKDKNQAATRFKWTKEKSQVALNLVKHGYKPKLVSIAVGCSLRTAQKFVETVTPKIDGESFKSYEIKRRGRKSKDVDQRLEAIKEVLSKDCTKTQVEIAADLKVSNTTVCRDLKRIGASWREKKRRTNGQ